MYAFLINNYLTIYAGCLVAVLTILWKIHEKIGSKKDNPRSPTRLLLVQFLAAIVVAMPVSFLSGNFFHQNTKEELIQQLGAFRKDFLDKLKSTEEGWAKGGFAQSAPANVPWPLLLDQVEFNKFLLDYKQLSSRIHKYFTPNAYGLCTDVLTLLDKPHVATYTVEKVGEKNHRLVVKHSFSHKQVNFIREALSGCSKRLEDQGSIIFNPFGRTTTSNDIRSYISRYHPQEHDTYEYWFNIAELAQSIRGKDKEKYLPIASEGFALFITGREDQGVPLMERAVRMVQEDKTVTDKGDELPLMMCALLYKYYNFSSPDNSGDYYPGKAKQFLAIGEEIGKKRFEEVFSSIKSKDYWDLDFKWHYANQEKSE